MSAGSPPSTRASTPSQKMRSRIFQHKSPSTSKSGWLMGLIQAANILKEAAELVPVPYVKGVLGTVLVLLDTVKQMKENQDDLRELCESTMQIAVFLGGQLVSHQGTSDLRTRCQELKSYLDDVVLLIKQLQKKSEGVCGHIKGFFKATNIKDKFMTTVEIGFKAEEIHIALMTMRLEIHEIHTAVVSSKNPVVHATQTPLNNCPLPSRIFHGRQTILDTMHHFFAPNSGKQQIYVLYGLGGVGKTQIALKFIEQSFHFADKISVDASTTETIETCLKKIATVKNAGNSSQEALQWLATKHEDWLLFFDNADDPKLNLNDLLPHCGHGNIIITSRNPELRGYGGSYTLVTDMDEDEAVAVLLQGGGCNVSPANTGIAAEIVKVLGYLPLAIVQAGAFILKSGALDSYLDLYTKNRARLLSEKPVQSHDNYAWTVYTTWQMSFDKLSPSAAMFLQLCSFLHRDGISEDIFSRADTYGFPSWGPSREELQKPLDFLSQFLGSAGEWDSLRFMEVTNEIRAYSLINFDPESRAFSIHPLVHSWCRNMINDPEPYHSIMVAIIGMSSTQIPHEDQELTSLKLISHVDSLLHENLQVAAEFGMEYGRIYNYSHRPKKAAELYVKVLQKWRKFLGDDHPDTIWASHHLGLTYTELGQFKQAEELLVIALEKRKTVLGVDHPDTLSVMFNLAVAFSRSGQLQKAEELEAIVLEKRRKLLGEDHLDTLNAMYNLAATFSKAGQLQKAEELEVVVLEKRRKILGEDHLDTLMSMNNLSFRRQKSFKLWCLRSEESFWGNIIQPPCVQWEI
ncbi:P-loop containing nucleoside triphosphate hydrolase protein [Mycena capillaripes]|nr:P-loop containing nucleoside triphosphate hydrolase protein [Mycena capillaripes]